ncbi:unnamed protein product [Arabis nemorensis]|uniref:NOL9 C-terminal domain-containing protein n=1 Tax=Arabis nemorensis TaxID=586526 RepID=A0A565CJW3_9BRAS|nr:unnamed protein product [Arabis nemorensis]
MAVRNLDDDGSIITIEVARDILKGKGTALASECPIDYKLGKSDRIPLVNVLRMTYFWLDETIPIFDANEKDEEDKNEHIDIQIALHPFPFESRLVELLKLGLVDAWIVMVDNYRDLQIYDPRDEEIKYSESGHLMLLTGKGIDESGERVDLLELCDTVVYFSRVFEKLSIVRSFLLLHLLVLAAAMSEVEKKLPYIPEDWSDAATCVSCSSITSLQPVVALVSCVGIVRGIDTERGILYVITPVPENVVERVGLLLQGCIQLPTCLLEVKDYRSPYLSPHVLAST